MTLAVYGYCPTCDERTRMIPHGHSRYCPGCRGWIDVYPNCRTRVRRPFPTFAELSQPKDD